MNAELSWTEPMSSVDYAWLRMDEPTNLMTITGAVEFDGPVDMGRLRDVMTRRFLTYERFRQRVVEPRGRLGWPRWELDRDFDLDAHLHRVTLRPPGNDQGVKEAIGELMSTQLDRNRPLWQANLIEKGDGGSVLVFRLHHCIADGIALMRVLLSLTDEGPDENGTAPVRPAAKVPGSGGLLATAARAREVGSMVLAQGRRLVGDPALNAFQLGRRVASPVTSLAHLLAMPTDPRTVFKGELGVSKRCTWSRTISLADVKLVARAAGATVNDVLVSAITGALGRYLQREGTPQGVEIRAVAPVNLRRPDDCHGLGNRFGLAFLGLPVGIADPVRRLQELKRRMDLIKSTAEPLVVYAVLAAIGAAHEEIERLALNIFGKKGTLVLTNVSGPKTERFMAGTRIRDIVYWVPQSGRLGLGVSIFSYAGGLRIGIATDAGLVPQPERLVDDLHVEIDDLLSRVRPPEQKVRVSAG